MKAIRHTSISLDPKVAATQNAENARDVNQSLAGKVSGYLQSVTRYAAIGATTARIPLVSKGRRPAAVMLAQAQRSNDPGSDLGALGRCNFYQSALELGVYEPSGLVADTLYDLTFLILE